MKIDKKYLLLFVIILVGLILRVYKLNENFIFSAEIGDNLLQIKNYIYSSSIPLIGPQTSHKWLFFGPLYYWLMIIFLPLFSYNPLVVGYLGIFVGLLVIVLNFFVVKKIINETVAFISSFLIAVSPLFIEYARGGRFFSFTLIPFYLFVFILYKVWNGSKNYLFLLGFSFSLFFNFHYSPLFLVIPLLLTLIFKRKDLKLNHYLQVILGFLFGGLPFIVYGFVENFRMLSSLLMWLPYRIAGFSGIIPSNNLNWHNISKYSVSLNAFLGETFILDEIYFPIITLIFIVALSFYTFKNIKKISKDFIPFFFISFLWTGLIANFIHLDVPIHYFLPIFPLPIIFISYLLFFFRKNKTVVITIMVTLVLIMYTNARISNSLPQFYINKVDKNSLYIPGDYDKIYKVSKWIIDNANGEPFYIVRFGVGDEFEKRYSQNYEYMMWYMGNEPKEGSGIGYYIYENSSYVPVNFNTTNIGNIIIYRKDQ